MTERHQDGTAVTAPFKIDVGRGGRDGRVSSEWFNRPADQRFLSLDDLYERVNRTAEGSTSRTIESRLIRVETDRDDPERLQLALPDADAPAEPTNWAFSQIAEIEGAPAGYQAFLATNLRRHGVDMVLDERTQMARLTAVPERVSEHFSKRTLNGTEAARAYAASLGIEPGEGIALGAPVPAPVRTDQRYSHAPCATRTKALLGRSRRDQAAQRTDRAATASADCNRM
jgi:hypothetical protein